MRENIVIFGITTIVIFVMSIIIWVSLLSPKARTKPLGGTSVIELKEAIKVENK